MALSTVARSPSVLTLALATLVLLSGCDDLIWTHKATVSANSGKDFTLCVHKAVGTLSGYSIDERASWQPIGIIVVRTPLTAYDDKILCDIRRLGSGDIEITFWAKGFRGKSERERRLITPLLETLAHSVSRECG
jgi:hypothetical protein